MPDLRALLAAHRPELLRHCYRMMGSWADAEDVAQDALLRAWEARERWTGAGPLGHWLLTIATNTCLNALERRRRLVLPQLERAPAARGTPVEPTDAFEDAGWLTPAPDARLFPDPHEAAERRERVALAFVALLQRLPARQRAALLLKDVVGMSAEEIAAALGLSLASVNSALHRARQVAGVGKGDRLRVSRHVWSPAAARTSTPSRRCSRPTSASAGRRGCVGSRRALSFALRLRPAARAYAQGERDFLARVQTALPAARMGIACPLVQRALPAARMGLACPLVQRALPAARPERSGAKRRGVEGRALIGNGHARHLVAIAFTRFGGRSGSRPRARASCSTIG